MKFLGILRGSALFILLSAFHGPRGVFCSNLEIDLSNESFTVEVSEDHEDSTVESSSELSSPAPKSNLVFQSSTWDDSHLASAVFFLEEFCKDLGKDKFKKEVCNRGSCIDGQVSKEADRVEYFYGDAKVICSNVAKNLKSLYKYLMPTYGPGNVAERKELPKNLYEDILEPEEFEAYAEWLKMNIPEIWKSLENMHHESLRLTEEQIKTDTSVGPLKYGFVYVYKGSWWSRPYFKNSLGAISRYCLAVMRSLAPMKHLLGCLDKNYGICPQESIEPSDNISEHIPEETSGFKESELSENLAGSPVKTNIVEEGEGNETENLL
ncbi:secreted antigen 1 [Babesia divergens]|uniref:Secreted antigen 1 n=1 Tax=Babesia divergens TaxID=32595 RepID=A0AAD9G730_BABDI|nr:secreted antigen 1 [Babesia divergens]